MIRQQSRCRVQPVIALYSIPLSFGAAVLAGPFLGTYTAGRARAWSPIEPSESNGDQHMSQQPQHS